MKYKIVLGAAAYLVVAWINTGAINEDFRCETPEIFHDAHEARHNFAFSLGWSLFPAAVILAPFLTGFYDHGFNWSSSPITNAEADECHA